MVVCLEQDADLYMAQLMPLPLTVSSFSTTILVLPFCYRLTWVFPEKGPLNGCVCVSPTIPLFPCLNWFLCLCPSSRWDRRHIMFSGCLSVCVYMLVSAVVFPCRGLLVCIFTAHSMLNHLNFLKIGRVHCFFLDCNRLVLHMSC